MSRIGNKIIELPAGVTVSHVGNVATVKGPKGTLEVVIPNKITLEEEVSFITVKRADEIKTTKQLHGTTRANLNNAVIGVSSGFEKKLEIIGIGYRSAMRGNDVVLDVGYSHEVVITPTVGSDITVVNPTTIIVKGISKHAVGQTAANIRAVREPEPYLGKGIKYSDEHIIRKEGKRAGSKK